MKPFWSVSVRRQKGKTLYIASRLMPDGTEETYGKPSPNYSVVSILADMLNAKSEASNET